MPASIEISIKLFVCLLLGLTTSIAHMHIRAYTPTDRQTTSFIEIPIEAGKLLGGKHEACFVLGVAGIEPMRPS